MYIDIYIDSMFALRNYWIDRLWPILIIMRKYSIKGRPKILMLLFDFERKHTHVYTNVFVCMYK